MYEQVFLNTIISEFKKQTLHWKNVLQCSVIRATKKTGGVAYNYTIYYLLMSDKNKCFNSNLIVLTALIYDSISMQSFSSIETICS